MHLRGIRAGIGWRDRCAIAALVALRTVAPIWMLLDRFGIHPPSPLSIVGRYQIGDGHSRWEVGADEGAAYLFATTALGHAYEELEPIDEGICIDVGASFGWYSIRWARQVGNRGRILAIEPQPKHVRSLVKNVALNQLSNVVVRPCAVGSQEGVLDLTIPRFGLSHYDASAVYHNDGPTIQVPMWSIDGLCDELGLVGVRLVKIDVEGFEPQVIRGMARVLKRDRPRVVFEAMTATALAACRVEFPGEYKIRELGEFDYLAEAG
jgi:FkbM family methyltransferase